MNPNPREHDSDLAGQGSTRRSFIRQSAGALSVGAIAAAAGASAPISSADALIPGSTYDGVLLDQGGQLHNVRSTKYGAIGNGLVDDTAAINAAIAACHASPNGGVVYLPPGTYAISGVVDVYRAGGNGVYLRGAGPYATKFFCTTATAQVRFSDGDGTTTAGLRGGGGGFWVDGNNLATHPLYIGLMSEATFCDIEVRRAAAGGAGITLSQSQNLALINVAAADNNGAGLRLDHGAGGMNLYRCEFSANRTNVEFASSAANVGGGYRDGPQDNKFVGCIIERIHPLGTDAHVHYGAGQGNWFVGCNITVSAAGSGAHTAMLRIRRDDPGILVPTGLHLVGCTFQGAVDTLGAKHGYVLDSAVDGGTTYFTDCTFNNFDTVFRLSDQAKVELDAYVAGNIGTRFVNTSGSNVEENLVRRRVFHPRFFIGDSPARFAMLSTVAGDAFNRHAQTASGSLLWGGGSSAFDTNLYRRAADQLKTDDKLLTALGLGVGNTVAASNPGSLIRKMEVFNEAGASLGFVAIYDNIA